MDVCDVTINTQVEVHPMVYNYKTGKEEAIKLFIHTGMSQKKTLKHLSESKFKELKITEEEHKKLPSGDWKKYQNDKQFILVNFKNAKADLLLVQAYALKQIGDSKEKRLSTIEHEFINLEKPLVKHWSRANPKEWDPNRPKTRTGHLR